MSEQKEMYKIEGDALEIAKEIRAFHQRVEANAEELRAKHEAEMNAAHEAAEAENEALWERLHEAVGGHPGEKYRLDMSYADELGVAFITEEREPERPAHPLAGLVEACSASTWGGGDDSEPSVH